MGDRPANGGARPVRIWRVSAAGRVGAIVSAVVLAAIAVSVPTAFADEGLALRALDFVVAAVSAVLAIPLLIAAFRARLILLPTSLVVVNPLRRWTLPLNSIRGVEPEWSGLAIELDDGETISAWAVQKTNVTRWLSRPGRSDYVAAEVRRAAGI
jgi:hypothetical protein